MYRFAHAQPSMAHSTSPGFYGPAFPSYHPSPSMMPQQPPTASYPHQPGFFQQQNYYYQPAPRFPSHMGMGEGILGGGGPLEQTVQFQGPARRTEMKSWLTLGANGTTHIIVYTHGAVWWKDDVKQGTGAAGYFFGFCNSMNGSCGVDGQQTNERAHLTAVIEALMIIARNSSHRSVQIRTTSNYVIKCATEWIHQWARHGWIDRQGKMIVNHDLLEALRKLLYSFSSIDWVLVPHFPPGEHAWAVKMIASARAFALSYKRFSTDQEDIELAEEIANRVFRTLRTVPFHPVVREAMPPFGSHHMPSAGYRRAGHRPAAAAATGYSRRWSSAE